MEWIVKQWSGAFGETELYENYECQGRKAKTLETKKWWSCTDFQQIRHPNPPTVSQFKMQTKTWFFDKIFTSSRVQNNFTESGQILSNNYEITHLYFVTLSFTQLWMLQQRFMSSLKVYLNEQHMMYSK